MNKHNYIFNHFFFEIIIKLKHSQIRAFFSNQTEHIDDRPKSENDEIKLKNKWCAFEWKKKSVAVSRKFIGQPDYKCMKIKPSERELYLDLIWCATGVTFLFDEMRKKKNTVSHGNCEMNDCHWLQIFMKNYQKQKRLHELRLICLACLEKYHFSSKSFDDANNLIWFLFSFVFGHAKLPKKN